MAWDDRFSGEALEPPIWGYCAYCGKPIRVGESYRLCEDDAICQCCEKKYALLLFQQTYEKQYASLDDLNEREREANGA
jgi:CRISPR/Cas system-associated protein Cas10 (large subunit of type III CRISPR-Cas system)